MAVRLYHATPQASRDGLEGLLAFVACGMTQSVTEDGDVRSALETSWVREDPASSDHLEGWYHDLLDAYLPPPAPKTPPRTSGPVPARVTPPGHEGQEGSGSPYGASTPAKKMPYTSAQRQDLATYCGLALSPDVVESADLPEFWQGFEDSRAKKTTARQAIEEHRRLNYPTGKLDRVTIFTPQFISDMQAISLDGRDGHFSWGEREKGFSPFALPPLSDNTEVSPLRDKYAAYESTEDRHRPSDRLELGRLGNGQLAGLPAGREEFYQWMDHLETMSELFFTPRSPLVWFFGQAKSSLLMPRYYRNFLASDWRAYLWVFHTAMREFFGKGHPTTAMRLVLGKLAHGELIHPREVPPELTAPPRPGARAGGGGGGARLEQGGPGPQPGEPRQKRPRTTQWEPAKRWSADKAKAKKAVESAGIRYTFSKMFPNAHTAEFWPTEFLGCIEGKPPRPCPYHFVSGSCNSREPYRSHHSFAKEPTKAVLDELARRIKARCEEVASNPALLKE